MRRKIKKVLDENINPYVAGHGGEIEILDYIDGVVFLKMSGGCQGCSQSSVTLRQGVERLLREEFGEKIRDIVDTTDHNAGRNPYYAAAK
jgi:Fe/S biogenesis protein NfuA